MATTYVLERNYVASDGKGYSSGDTLVTDGYTQEQLDAMVADGLISEVEAPADFQAKSAAYDDRRVPPSEEAAAEAPTLNPIPPSSYQPSTPAVVSEEKEVSEEGQVTYNAAERPGDVKRTGDKLPQNGPKTTKGDAPIDVERLNPEAKSRSK